MVPVLGKTLLACVHGSRGTVVDMVPCVDASRACPCPVSPSAALVCGSAQSASFSAAVCALERETGWLFHGTHHSGQAWCAGGPTPSLLTLPTKPELILDCLARDGLSWAASERPQISPPVF